MVIIIFRKNRNRISIYPLYKIIKIMSREKAIYFIGIKSMPEGICRIGIRQPIMALVSVVPTELFCSASRFSINTKLKPCPFTPHI